MPEPLKNCYSKALLQSIARDCKGYYPKFETTLFINSVYAKDWTQLELKDRMHRVAERLAVYLPKDYTKAVEILLQVADGYTGLAHMCFPDFIEQFGLDDFKTSMMALEKLTDNSSSEFAIRPFIIRYPDKTMKKMKQWSKSKNYHVRRLASEGCRPRLPWAMALPEYKKDPSDVLAIILDLVDDKELYVRRSVANNLNDISKDNPQRLVEIARQHLGQSKNVDWVIKHACRGLLKQGHKEVLTLFGFTDINHIKLKNFQVDKNVRLGESLNFQFELMTNQSSLGKLRIEFIIDFMKSNGKLAGKIFKISEGEYQQKKRRVSKYFSFRPISTRKYYLGEHRISIVVNGVKIASRSFELID